MADQVTPGTGDGKAALERPSGCGSQGQAANQLHVFVRPIFEQKIRSGKSSLYHALKQLFNIDVEPPTFSANLFGKDE
jgi:hypothetical protein